jgi:exoribonuclease R
MYEDMVEPLYGSKRDSTFDNILKRDNEMSHVYNVRERIDMTGYPVYSIDPDGCEDADDAFSVYKEYGKLYLAIHIADPTEYINIKSRVWKDIEKRIVTKYPSNKKPIHMMLEDIMERSSLMVNRHGDVKLAISIVTEIDMNSYLPIGNVKLLFTTIKVSECNAFSYEQAGELFETNDAIQYGIKISKALTEARRERTKAVLLNDVTTSNVKYDGDTTYLYRDKPNEKLMKQMIAEFAIFANSFVGEFLKINFEGVGIFRICSASDWLYTVYSEITGEELLNEIIVNGIRAEYISSVKPHDLVGSPEYCHFTSPIRRLSDCVCHYLLKYIHLKPNIPYLPIPFTNSQLEMYSNNCMQMTRAVKKIQYKDTKYRLLQTMKQMLISNPTITIKYYVSSYVKSFFNIIICNINEHSIYLSYTLIIRSVPVEYEIKEIKTMDITLVSMTGRKYDEGSIPQLDRQYVYVTGYGSDSLVVVDVATDPTNPTVVGSV